MRVTLFVPCYADTLAPNAAIATVTILERLGHEVVYPEEQTCCGQVHGNSGHFPETLRLAARFVDVFEDADIVVAPSASCVGTVRHLYPRLARRAGRAELAGRVEALGARVFELSEALTGPLEAGDTGSFFPHRVTYHPTCHSLRALRVGDAPLRLLEGVEGIELVPPAPAEVVVVKVPLLIVEADPDTGALLDKRDLERLARDGAGVRHAILGLEEDGTSLTGIGG